MRDINYSKNYNVASAEEKKTFQKKMITMILLLVFQAFMMAAVSASDAVMLGFFAQESMSAVSLAGQVTYVLTIAVIVRNLISCVSKGIVTRFAAGCGVVSGAVMLGIRPLILDFVMLTQKANEYFSDMLFICCIYMFFISVNSTVIGGIFCAGGKSKFGCICDAVTLWCLVIPAAAFGAFYFKLPVIIVYLILCLDEVIKIPIVFWYFKCYSWVQNITRQSS